MVLILLELGCTVAGVPEDAQTKCCWYRSIHMPCSALPSVPLLAGQRMARSWRRLHPSDFPPPHPVPEPRGAGDTWKRSRRRSESVALK